MQIKISARHGRLDDSLQDLIRDKAEKLNHLFERLTMVEVTVNLKHDHSRQVEFVVQAEHKHDFVARETNGDIMTAVDLALAKLEGQLRRYKERIQNHRGTPSARDVAGAPDESPGEE